MVEKMHHLKLVYIPMQAGETSSDFFFFINISVSRC